MDHLNKHYFGHRNHIESNRVNIDEEDEFLVEGYIPSIIRSVGLVVLSILSGGILVILCSWRPSLKARIANRRCSLEQAQLLILRDKHGKEFIEKVHTAQRDHSFTFKYFYHKKLKYIWKSEYRHFEKLKGLESERCNVIYSQVEGATSSEASLKLDLYGTNSIEIEVLPIWKLVLDEVTGPFYLYQFFICSIWLIQFYYQFATCILLLSMVSVATHVWQTRKQSIALRRQVQSASKIVVFRDNSPVEISSIELVPGDVIVLPKHTSGFLMECDAVLMTGSCLVDESMLTGESAPVPKVALVENSNSVYSPSVHKSNTLFSGTRVLNVQTPKQEDLVKAVVVRTGFSTAKGELARSILFPSQSNNNLKKQLIKMSAIFFMIGLPCMAYTVYALSRFNYSNRDIFIIVLDVATFLIPPVLPAVLTSINVHAQRRLKTKGIYCLNPRMISCSGEVDVMCFDKTGTLTEDSIDFAGIVRIQDGNFSDMLTDVHSIRGETIVKSMAVCHSLVQYEGNLEGDDLDLKLFAATGWTFATDLEQFDLDSFGKIPERIVTYPEGKQTLAILKQFPFESFLQRMLVIVKDVNLGKHIAIVKGAPEIVASFCSADTIPKDFLEIFEWYTRKGFRVLATAMKVICDNVQECLDMGRTEVECKMSFVGLYLFKNKLKDTTFDVLQELSKAKIRCIMATGDSLLTGISVAEECRLVHKSDAIIKVRALLDKSKALRVNYSYVKYPDFVLVNDNNANFELGEVPENENFDVHLAIDGDSFNVIKSANPQLLNRIVHKGTIFARMSPDHKLSLVNLLQKQNHNVGMCGDGKQIATNSMSHWLTIFILGANDCGALRVADAGISLSMAEASVASPFTYKQKDITCVPTLLKEGRCTLVAIFGAFKYQVCYCFILLGTVLILFWHGTKPAEGTYVFVDIILNILPPMLFGTTEPYKKLVSTMPIRNILSIVPQVSMYSFILVQVSIYYFVSRSLISKTWYVPMDNNLNNIMEPPTNHLSYAVFSANMMSYVISAIIFAPGPPYRDHFFANKKYIAVVVINFMLIGLATIIAPSLMLDLLKFKPMPFDFRLKIFAISMANFVFCFVWEKYFLDHVLRQFVERIKCRFEAKSSKKFKAIEQEIKESNWPFDNIVSNDREKSPNKRPVTLKGLTRFASEARL